MIKYKFLITILFLFIFEPNIFVKIPIMNFIYILGLVISFVLTILMYYKKGMVSKMVLILVIWRMSLLYQTLCDNGDMLKWGYFSIVLITCEMLIEIYLEYDAKAIVDILLKIFLVLLSINYILMLVYPKGIIEDLHFLGIRTRFTDIIFPAILLTLIRDYVNEKRYSSTTIYTIIISIITIAKVQIVTAIMGSAVFILSYILIKKRLIRRLLNCYNLTIIGLISTVLVVFLRIQDRYANFIENYFKKSATLSYRTYIWDVAIPIIKEKLIFGYGIRNDGNFAKWKWNTWQAHNQWLQLFYDGGLICAILFLIILFMFSKRTYEYIDSHIGVLIASIYSAFMIMMITEIFSYTPYFYIVIFIGFNMQHLVNYQDKHYLKKVRFLIA